MNFLVSTRSHQHLVLCVDAATLMLKGENKKAHDGDINSIHVSADGAKIVSGGSDQTIKVWGERFQN
jgi:WD40 repeat protein